jgi:hypothetical protein
METNDPRPDSFDDVWEVAEFAAREALLLRSFIEYLRVWPDPPEEKLKRLQNWKAEIGLQLGRPDVEAFAQELYQRLRAAPPEARSVILRSVLGKAYADYFGQSAK